MLAVYLQTLNKQSTFDNLEKNAVDVEPQGLFVLLCDGEFICLFSIRYATVIEISKRDVSFA